MNKIVVIRDGQEPMEFEAEWFMVLTGTQDVERIQVNGTSCLSPLVGPNFMSAATNTIVDITAQATRVPRELIKSMLLMEMAHRQPEGMMSMCTPDRK